MHHNGLSLIFAAVMNLTASFKESKEYPRGFLQERLLFKDERVVSAGGGGMHACVDNEWAKGNGFLITTDSNKNWYAAKAFEEEESPSTANALEFGKVEKMRVEESNSFSILALILMPAVLSIFPLAVFQEASLPAALVYAICTDVLSILPLATKGVELLIYGSRKHYSHVTDISGVSHTPTMSYLATWVTECRMKPYVLRRGVAYVTGAGVIMIFGIVLEVLSRYMVSRKKPVRTWSGLVVLDEDGHLKTLRML